MAKLQAEAEKLIADARAAAQKQVAEAKALVSAECAKELAEAKAVRACWGRAPARARAGRRGLARTGQQAHRLDRRHEF